MKRFQFERARIFTGQTGRPVRDATGGVPIHSMHTLTGVTVASGTIAVNTNTGYTYAGQAKSVKVTQTAASTDVDINVRENIISGCNPIIVPVFPNIATAGAFNDQIRIRMTDSQGFGTAYIETQLSLVPGIWNPLLVNLGQMTSTLGTVDRTDIRTIRLTILDGADTQEYYFGRITMGRKTKPKFFFRTDDHYLNVYTVFYPLIDAYGWSSCMGCTNYFYGRTAGFMGSTDQFQTLQNAGWDMVNHTYDHPQLVTSAYTQAACEAQFTTNAEFYASKGINTRYLRSIYIAPYGEIDNTVRKALRAQGFQLGMSTLRGKQTTSDNPPFDGPETFAWGEPLTLRIINPRNGSYKSGATVLAELDQMIQVGGTSCIMLHSVPSAAAGDSGDDLLYNSGDVEVFLAGLRVRERQKRVEVVNARDLVDLDTSLLDEPSLERLAPASAPGTTGYALVSASNTFSDVGSTPAVVGGPVLRLAGANSINWDAPAGTGGVLRSITNGGQTFYCIEFNDTAGSLISGTLGMVQNSSVFVVARVLTLDGTTLNQFFVDGNGAANRFGIYAQGTQDKWACIVGTELYGAGANDTAMATDTSWHVFELHAEGAKTVLVVDGDFVCGDANTQTSTTLTLGNRYAAAGSAGTNVQIAAVIPFPGVNLRRNGLADHLRASLMDTYGITSRVPLTGHYVPIGV